MAFNFASKSVFVTRPVKSGILFSTVVNAEVVAKLLISGILFSTTVNAELVAYPLMFGILLSTSVILAIKSVFLYQITNIRNLFFYLVDFICKI